MIPGCPDFGEYRDARGRIPVDPNIFKQPRSLVMATSGQSMLGNYGSWLTPYNPIYGDGVFELDTVSGNIYRVTDGSFPTMGMDGWFSGETSAIRRSVLPYWADILIKVGKYQRVLLAGHNIGGTHAARWCPIGDMYPRSEAVFLWLKNLGIPPNIWIEMLGQADVDINTPSVVYQGNTLGVATSADNFKGLMQWKWAGLRGIGMTAPIVMGQGAHWTNVSNLQTARYAMVKQGQALCLQGGVTLGPDDDEWPDSMRVDGVHPADAMRYNQFINRWLPVF